MRVDLSNGRPEPLRSVGDLRDLERAAGNDDVARIDDPAARRQPEPGGSVIECRQARDIGIELDRGSNGRAVGPEVVDDLVARHERVRLGPAVVQPGERHRPVRRDQAKRVPAVLPAAAQRGSPLEDDVLPPGLGQEAAHHEAGLARAHDDGLDGPAWHGAPSRECRRRSSGPRSVPGIPLSYGTAHRSRLRDRTQTGAATAARPRHRRSSPPTTGPSVDVAVPA